MNEKNKKRRIFFIPFADNESLPEIKRESESLKQEKSFSSSKEDKSVPAAIMQHLAKWVEPIYTTFRRKTEPEQKEHYPAIKGDVENPGGDDDVMSGTRNDTDVFGKAETASVNSLYHRGSFSNPDSMHVQSIPEDTFHKMLETAEETHNVLQELYETTKEIHKELTE